jgi:hypothetical protein
MKTLLRTNKYAVLILGTVGCLLIFGCTQPDTPPRTTEKVDIQESRIAITPVIKLTPEEKDKLDAVLRKYDKKLYRITTWENGKITKVRGEGLITDRQRAEEAQAARNGASWEGHHSVCPTRSNCNTQLIAAKEKQLLTELAAVLQKH